MIPVLVINLAADTARLTHITHQLIQMNIPFQRVEAVNGRALPLHEVWRYSYYDRQFTAGEVGCALTYLKLFRQIAYGPDRFVCILEDDVEIMPAIADIAQLVAGWQRCRDGIRLGIGRGRGGGAWRHAGFC